MIKKKFGVYILISMSLIVFSQCKETPKNQINGVFTLVTGTVTVNEKPARVGMRVAEKDTIFVEKESSGILQFDDKALLTIRPNTRIKIASLVKSENGESKVHLAQYSGSTFNRVLKNKKVAYKIATPTTTAGVRGTSFSVSFDESKKSKIKLLDGKVAVKKIEPKKEGEKLMINEEVAFSDFDNQVHQNKENKQSSDVETSSATSEIIILEAGEKVEVDSKATQAVQKRKLEAFEKEQLETMKEIPMVSSEQLKGAVKGENSSEIKIDGKINQIINKTEEKAEEEAILKEKNKKEANKPMTIEELRQKYGRLSKVTTKSGKTYIGSFRQGAGSMIVITTHGSVSIPTSDVARVTPY